MATKTSRLQADMLEKYAADVGLEPDASVAIGGRTVHAVHLAHPGILMRKGQAGRNPWPARHQAHVAKLRVTLKNLELTSSPADWPAATDLWHRQRLRGEETHGAEPNRRHVTVRHWKRP